MSGEFGKSDEGGRKDQTMSREREMGGRGSDHNILRRGRESTGFQ